MKKVMIVSTALLLLLVVACNKCDNNAPVEENKTEEVK